LTSLTYTYRLFSMNAIFKSSAYDELTLKIGLPPSVPGKPTFQASSFSEGTITIAFTEPLIKGGWPVTGYLVWVDNGHGVMPANHISISATSLRY